MKMKCPQNGPNIEKTHPTNEDGQVTLTFIGLVSLKIGPEIGSTVS